VYILDVRDQLGPIEATKIAVTNIEVKCALLFFFTRRRPAVFKLSQ